MRIPPFAPTVALPRMNALEALAIGVALKTALDGARAAQVRASESTAANTHGLGRRVEAGGAAAVPVVISAGVDGSMRRLEAACGALAQARRQRAQRVEARVGVATLRQLFNRYKQAWTTLRAQLDVWRRADALEHLPEASRAAVERVLPPGRASMLRGSAREVWVAGDDVLALVRSEEIDALFASLGGGGVIARLAAAHDELGAALGVTAALPSRAATGVALATAITLVQRAMREYVLKVHAMVDPDAPGSDELATRLLAPLADHRKSASRRRRSKGAAPLRPTGSG